MKCEECKEGFTGNKCDECKPNITGQNCNQCNPNYFNYPLCQGTYISQQILFLKAYLTYSFLSQTANATLMVQLLWNVERTMVFAHAKKALPE